MLCMDFRACRWPAGYGPERVAGHFLAMNPENPPQSARRVVTFSHFLPRIDLIPFYVPRAMRSLDAVMGSTGIERQLRRLGSVMHVYGHSHINRWVTIDGVTYVNNAFGYPQESAIAARRLVQLEHRGTRGPIQPVGAGVHARSAHHHLARGRGGGAHRLVEEAGADHDLQRRGFACALQRRSQHPATGGARETLGVRVAEQCVGAVVLPGPDGRHQQAGAGDLVDVVHDPSVTADTDTSNRDDAKQCSLAARRRKSCQ